MKRKLTFAPGVLPERLPTRPPHERVEAYPNGPCPGSVEGHTYCGPACYLPLNEGYEQCPNGHGLQLITESGHNSGFGGEGLWWATFACGCQQMEEGDIEP